MERRAGKRSIFSQRERPGDEDGLLSAFIVEDMVVIVKGRLNVRWMTFNMERGVPRIKRARVCLSLSFNV